MITSVIPLPQRIEPGSFLSGDIDPYNSVYKRRFARGRNIQVPDVAFLRIDSLFSGYVTHSQDLFGSSFRTEHVFAIDKYAPINYRTFSVQGPDGEQPLLGIPISVKIAGNTLTRTYLFSKAIEYLLNHSEQGRISLITPPNDLLYNNIQIPQRRLLTMNEFIDKIVRYATPPVSNICNIMTPDAPLFVATAMEQAERILDTDPTTPVFTDTISNLIGLLDQKVDHTQNGMSLTEFVGGPLVRIADPISQVCISTNVVNLQQFLPLLSVDPLATVNNAMATGSMPLSPEVRVTGEHIDPTEDEFLWFTEMVRQLPYEYYAISVDCDHAGGIQSSTQTPVSSFDIDGHRPWFGEQAIDDYMALLYETEGFQEDPTLESITMMKTPLDEIWAIRKRKDGSVSAKFFPLPIESLITPSIIDDFIL